MVVEERETKALDAFLRQRPTRLVASKLAVVEVTRAARIAGPSPQRDAAVRALLDACQLVDVSEEILITAASLASERLRSLDAIHLATALDLRVGTMLAYDRRLAEAASEQGVRVLSPGA